MSRTEFLPQALSETEAARYVGMSRSFLRKARMEGNRDQHTPAPPFLRIGRKILYLRGDLDQWLRQHRVTSQPPTGQDSNDVLRAASDG